MLLTSSIFMTGCDATQITQIINNIAQGIQQAMPAIKGVVDSFKNIFGGDKQTADNNVVASETAAIATATTVPAAVEANQPNEANVVVVNPNSEEITSTTTTATEITQNTQSVATSKEEEEAAQSSNSNNENSDTSPSAVAKQEFVEANPQNVDQNPKTEVSTPSSNKIVLPENKDVKKTLTNVMDSSPNANENDMAGKANSAIKASMIEWAKNMSASDYIKTLSPDAKAKLREEAIIRQKEFYANLVKQQEELYEKNNIKPENRKFPVYKVTEDDIQRKMQDIINEKSQ